MHKMRLLKHLLVRFSGVTERKEYFETKIHKLNSISFRVSKKKMTSSVQRHFYGPTSGQLRAVCHKNTQA